MGYTYELTRRKGERSAPPRIYVWCNSCAPQWHVMAAIAEDGTYLGGHVCSSHGFGPHDMGLVGEWKHEGYDEHYPDGWELVWVEDFREAKAYDPKFAAAIKANESAAKAAEEKEV